MPVELIIYGATFIPAYSDLRNPLTVDLTNQICAAVSIALPTERHVTIDAGIAGTHSSYRPDNVRPKHNVLDGFLACSSLRQIARPPHGTQRCIVMQSYTP